MRLVRVLFAALALLGASAVAQAQSASTTVTATVVSPLVVTGTAPLSFGVVIPGVNTIVAPTATNSGRLQVSGMNGAQITMVFTLPATLTSGANSMPINSFQLRLGPNPTPTGLITAPAVSGLTLTVNSNVTTIYAFIGGRVQPTLAQASGVYSAPIILTTALTGL